MAAKRNSIVPVERIHSYVLLVRGQKVILDRDLAALYQVETRVLNQAVQRNIKRFPSDFMFELTRNEITRISQFVISSDLKYSRRVCAFTEQGVAMLSSVLRSPRAVKVNIEIMRLRQTASSSGNSRRPDLQARRTGEEVRCSVQVRLRGYPGIDVHARTTAQTDRIPRQGAWGGLLCTEEWASDWKMKWPSKLSN